MALALEEITRAPALFDDAAALAERVRASVVVVRGTRAGAGSGVVWNDRGLIITNHHVVPGDRADILPGRGVRLQARVIGRSESLDLAALQVEGDIPAGVLSPAEIGDSTALRVGELVVAVGNPMGERNVVTLGIVSASGTAGFADGQRAVIRANIRLRPGNSGGALADSRGRVVGIPHMVVGYDLALAVPSHAVQQFLRGLGDDRAFLGLYNQRAASEGVPTIL